MSMIRATILLAATAMLLAACDPAPQATTPVAPPAPQACNCTPTAAAPAPVAEVVHHRHHHHRAWTGGSYGYSSESYSESSESEVTAYDYVSDSHSSESSAHTRDHRVGYGLWLDGYNRAHDSDIHARRAGTMTRGRLKPWAGYDADCDK